MLDMPARYPLLRGRRRIQRRSRSLEHFFRDRMTLGTLRRLAVLTALLLGLAVIMIVAHRATAPDPVEALAAGASALERGDYSTARNRAQEAASGRPDWAAAQAMLARAAVALGDGPAAVGAAERALTLGYPPARVRHLLARAYWLAGDADAALRAVRRSSPRFRAYAARVEARIAADEGDAGRAEGLLVGVLARYPRSAETWTDLGRIRFGAGDLAGAWDAAARAVALDRTDPEVLTLAGELVRSRYGLTASLPWFRAALQRDAAFPAALIEEAATLGEMGRHVEMLAATRAALAARPGSPQAFYLLAVMAARSGQYDLARAMLARSDGGVDGMPGALLLAGALDYAQDRPQQAIGSWSELVARQPMNVVARRLLGSAQWRAGDAKAALATLRPIALRADADSYTLRIVARAFEATGERGWAARLFDRASATSPGGSAPFGNDDALPVLELAMLQSPGDPAKVVEYVRGLVEAGRMEDALAQALALARAAPGAPAAQLLVGDVLTAGGRPVQALTAYRGAASLSFTAPTLLRLIEAAAAARQPQVAARALELYFTQNPASPLADRLAANVQGDAGDWASALETLDRLRLSIGARDAMLLAALARAEVAGGDPARALRFARAAYALAPMNAAVADSYGWALYQAGDVPLALQLARKAVALAPDDPVARWHQGQLLAEAGKPIAARAAIMRALADPRFGDRKAALALLRAM
ncbi:tetratricopeptide repeat protein [Sphingomonas sp.]|uniref:tetratricopeptide repeat protein n=1 Tax=Sphingomonas sp. TaxID=28214 RepID=UPI0035C7D8AA